MNNFEILSDKDLYLICKRWGSAVLEARRKFAGLLPEVYRREQAAWARGGSWVRKRGFSSLYEFAARLAGMSRNQVDEVIRTDKRLEDKPILRNAFVNGEVSLNKLARVVSIVTVENQKEILGKVEALSKVALDCFVKDYKRENGPAVMQNVCGLDKPQNRQTGLYGQNENADIGLTVAIAKPGPEQDGQGQAETGPSQDGRGSSKKIPVSLDEDIAKELLEMQSKNIDVDGLLREFLMQRRAKLETRKKVSSEKQEQEREDRALIGYPAKRYVPAEIRKIIKEEFGDKCSAEGCQKPAENLHHEKGFAKNQCHDPRNLKPLCRGHHELAHAD